jgi:hypothetical protein
MSQDNYAGYVDPSDFYSENYGYADPGYIDPADFYVSDSSASDEFDWSQMGGTQPGGMSDAEVEAYLNSIPGGHGEYDDAENAAMSERTMREIIESSGGSGDWKGVLKNLLEKGGPALIGANAISQAIRNKPGSFERATGASSFKGGENIQAAIPASTRRAAAGGLMSFATGGSTFDPNAYLAINSDVAAAAASSGMTPEEFAQYHYNTWGSAEGRNTGADLASSYGALSGGTQDDLNRFLASTVYSPEQLAAYTGHSTSGFQAAIDAARQTSSPASFEQQQQNLAAAATGQTELAKKLWDQYGQDPSALRQAAANAGVTGGDMAAATGYDPKVMTNYMQQWLNPAITRYSSIDDMAAGALAARNDTSGFVVGPMNAPTMKDYYDQNPQYSPITEGGIFEKLPLRVSPTAGGNVYGTMPGQPYPFQPGDIYNRSPAYANINDPGVSPIARSESPMPMGGNAFTKPYEAIRYSSRLLQEGTRPGAAWNRGGGQVEYVQKAAGGLMGLQEQTNLGRYAGGGLGRLVQGPGDGVSDSVPAMIGGQQPALIAQGEYVLPARVVSELGNGSTEAGAQRIDQMVAKIEQMGKSAGRGKDSGAHQLLG